jgi:uncharacterized protein
MRFAGYAAIFDAPDRGGDIVRRGAFAGADAGSIPLCWQHDRRRCVGRIDTLAEDRRGLRVIATLADPDAARMVGSGDVRGLSFGYRVRAARRGTYRELEQVELIEVSLVSDPMQPLARVHAVEISQPEAGSHNTENQEIEHGL